MRKFITLMALLALSLVACKNKDDNRPRCEKEDFGWVHVRNLNANDTFAISFVYDGKQIFGDSLQGIDSGWYEVPAGYDRNLRWERMHPYQGQEYNFFILTCKEKRFTMP